MQSSATSLAFCDIGKTFPGVTALAGISFTCHPGAVHALMGENGAGKSTLLKILSGAYQPSSGHLEIDGKPVAFRNTQDALANGVAIIYQELHLVPELSVAENICLGQFPGRAGIVDRASMRAAAGLQLRRLMQDIDPDTPVKYLSIGQRQMVEIAKALLHEARIIAFDEPTSSLSAREIEQLERVIRDLRAEGRIVIYVSHRMEEIYRMCDEITVFKDGRLVQTFTDIAQLSHDRLVRAMVGRDIEDIFGYAPRPLGEVRLAVSQLDVPGLAAPVDLTVRRGEVVGLFGLVGAGRTTLLRALFGADPARSGEVRVDGALCTPDSPREAIRQGMLLCPEDRKAQGIVPVHSVADNINLSARRHHLGWRALINRRWERHNAVEQIKSMRIKTPGPDQLIRNLSGGNQQKAILARWLSEDNIKIMILDEPTRGIDVGAKHEIYQVIFELAKKGVAVLFASSDLPEALGLADRVIVMREGKVVGERSHDEANEESVLGLAMLSAAPTDKDPIAA
ncbi:L-arabinose transporter ATP-binding protein [Robbsia andropogonis]|uniref:L-arabinose transporter ATP-binding protein n=1 Tax=Robbsia andropogonis TaxID=28092 RepID=A0A0F5K1I6_9BURK|nr:L-arabinose ABC transporter ATP-binding protein AraG [Robbsia andropogonis]KKB63780.1 L-arabinose transporter ATP-binding protein [Robbsia andropogonis]MCP1119257.1 L-arabinose ABC transporter ATP-binding protein AraG [Robbsia andropogonis]MCP1129097.1 L-arabinose ABC transporter ATP-binding protein AraG [Robbsia andropogonis]